jgi:N-acetylglucosaminyldiphosphoundecaprenol N-acetyl-beta-D-mannosaminyltransferase
LSAVAFAPTAQTQAAPFRYDLFGYPVDRFRKDDLLSFIESRVATGRKAVVANLNLHALHCLNRSPEMAALFASDDTFVHIDGMPIVWLSKIKGTDVSRDNRLTYLDWAVDQLAIAAEKGWKVAYLGSDETICKAGIQHFRTMFPGLKIEGWDGYFDMDDTSAGSKLTRTVQAIDTYAPDLLIVGMGMPRQEAFLQRHSASIGFKVAICAGAFFEYFVGGQELPPRWMGRMGLEWAFRLASNPRRYGHRYLIEPIGLGLSLSLRMVRRKFL